MKNIVIIAGGKSPEHEVSIVSARNIYQYFDKQQFNVEVVGISKKGEWFHLSEQSLLNTNEIGANVKHLKLCFMPFDPWPLRYQDNI